MKNLDKWNSFYNSREPQNEELPSPWQDELNDFQRMIILRVIRPDKVSVPVYKWKEGFVQCFKSKKYALLLIDNINWKWVFVDFKGVRKDVSLWKSRSKSTSVGKKTELQHYFQCFLI